MSLNTLKALVEKFVNLIGNVDIAVKTIKKKV